MKNTPIVFILVFFISLNVLGQVAYPGKNPGKAKISLKKEILCVENKSLCANWTIQDNKILALGFLDKSTGHSVSFEKLPLFQLKLKNGTVLTSNDFTLTGFPQIKNANVNQNSQKYSERLNGKVFSADLVQKVSGLTVHWNVILKDGSNYIRQEFTFRTNDSILVEKFTLIRVNKNSGAKKNGGVDGSPIVDKNMFFALEHPMNQIEENNEEITSYLPRLEPLTSAAAFTTSIVWGTTPKGQLRRGFLYYIERERAAPYRQNLHYNSWYDLSWIDRKLDETSCIDRIQTFADSLILKRDVKMDAFLFDDGWDDNQTLWQFNKGFPSGFTKMAQIAAKYKADLGVWISPWGGYMEDQKQRLEYGRKQNPPFETNANGFSLSGPIYYDRFKGVASNFVQKYNVSLFKFDGVGAGNGANGASVTYQKDIEALVKLISELRGLNPKLYFSLTVGTWPSIYWLNYGDVIWRAGRDTHTAGSGSNRQKWITYRDAETYKNIVKRAPLFPLNALMIHGICIAENGPPGKFEFNDKDISDEIWSYFGTGISLQELYINPHKLNTKNWDTLSDAAKWARRNADVLPDVHWVGGDPIKAEVYGFAAWSKLKAVLTLRNPSSEKKSFVINTSQIFQIPSGFNTNYSFYNAKKLNEKQLLGKGEEITVTLEPYDVIVLDAVTR